METFVFSYQRGPYLDNFLRSVRDCEWPGPVTVVDDRSTDPSTLEVLDRAERSGIAVVRRQHSQGGGRLGRTAGEHGSCAVARPGSGDALRSG